MKMKSFKKIIIYGIFFIIISTSSIQASINNIEINKNYYSNKKIDITSNINQNITDLMKELYMISVSAGIIINDRLVWNKGYGICRDLYNIFTPKKSKIPLKDTIYVAASISKPITATAILQLYDDGKLNLSDNINNYLDFNIKNPYAPNINITIKMLLNHTSGLNASTELWVLSIIRNFIKNHDNFFKLFLISKSKFFERLCWIENFQPGINHSYSNIAYALLDYIVEIISNKSFNEYCKENIFDPLEMYNTSFNFRDFKKNQLASQYIWYHNLGIYVRLPRFNFPLTGAGGVRTTIEDLSHFLIAHMNNGSYKNTIILKNSTVDMMHKLNYLITGPGENKYYGYCLGWIIYNDTNYSGHDGDLPAGHARMKWNKSNDLGIIYFWNSEEKPGDPSKRVELIEKLEKELLKNVINV